MDNRRKDGKFGPGNCANPSGRPKVAEEFRARARKAVDEHVLDAWIGEVEGQGENWVKCSELLAAYGYGKPSQPLEHAGAGGGSAVVIEVVPVDARRDDDKPRAPPWDDA